TKGGYLISTTLGPEASASCGIAVAHYMYPLKQATAEARKAEKYAKNTLGRDAFAVNIVKRSGETFITGSKWRVLNTARPESEFQLMASQVLYTFQEAIRKDWLSSKFIVDVEAALDVLVAMPPEAVLAEIRRLFNQHNEGFNKIKLVDKDKKESSKERKDRIRNEKDKFFNETIGFMIKHSNELLDNAQNNSEQQPGHEHKPADWPGLRNVVHLMDMAYYIGKGGGR
ncbi:MAG: Cas10/Cmr2 second palm domain-containing protein, partial [Cyclonatronaceae bacterium]